MSAASNSFPASTTPPTSESVWISDHGFSDSSLSSMNDSVHQDDLRKTPHHPKLVTSSFADPPPNNLCQYHIKGLEPSYPDVMGLSLEQIKSLIVRPIAQRRGPRGGVSEPFPVKLYEMLSFVDQHPEPWKRIVRWHDHGRSFMISLPQDFVQALMPRFFKQTKLTSFQRQLNLYGFLKITGGPDKGGYYHPLFLRGRDDIPPCLVRIRTRGQPQMILPESPNIFLSSLYDLPHCSDEATKSWEPLPLFPAKSDRTKPTLNVHDEQQQSHKPDMKCHASDGDDFFMDGLMELMENSSSSLDHVVTSERKKWPLPTGELWNEQQSEPDYGGCIPMFQGPEYVNAGVVSSHV